MFYKLFLNLILLYIITYALAIHYSELGNSTIGSTNNDLKNLTDCKYNRQFCGGFAGIGCPLGYICYINWNCGSTDCGGICMKRGCPKEKDKCYVSCFKYCTDFPLNWNECDNINVPKCLEYKKCALQNEKCEWINTPNYENCLNTTTT